MTDIKMRRGDTYIFDVPVTRDDAPVDLAGAKAWFTMKRNRRDPDSSAILQHDSADGSLQVRILTPTTAGIVRVWIKPTDTASLAISYYPFDVQVKEADGTVGTVEHGFVELEPDSTLSTV